MKNEYNAVSGHYGQTLNREINDWKQVNIPAGVLSNNCREHQILVK